MTIGEKIKELREENEWLQRELAELISVTTNMVGYWEQGKNEPSVFNCILLADVFGVTLDELCCREVKKNGQSD
jgi:transcriptional regulator with XRE-family HTH domain